MSYTIYCCGREMEHHMVDAYADSATEWYCPKCGLELDVIESTNYEGEEDE